MSGRGESEKTKIRRRAILDIVREKQPLTVRAVCYQLFTRKLIPSMEKKHTNTVSRDLVRMREAGEIHWHWIVDETRQGLEWASYQDPESFLDTVRHGYSRDAWQDQPNWVMVWSEKSTIKGTLMPVLMKYGLPFHSFHGHTSATAIHQLCQQTRRRGKTLTALYVGDWDPSGLHMSEEDLPERINRYHGDIKLVRVAVDRNDADPATGVPWFEPAEKAKDPRFNWFMRVYATRCFELDALDPVVLRDRVEGSVLQLLDLDAWEHSNSIEHAEVESMRTYFDAWPGISVPANKYSEGGA